MTPQDFTGPPAGQFLAGIQMDKARKTGSFIAAVRDNFYSPLSVSIKLEQGVVMTNETEKKARLAWVEPKIEQLNVTDTAGFAFTGGDGGSVPSVTSS